MVKTGTLKRRTSSKRGFLDIVACILEVVRSGKASKTHIVYTSNLNFVVIKRYLPLLLQKGFLRVEADNSFHITEKGLTYLQRYRELLSLFGGEGGKDNLSKNNFEKCFRTNSNNIRQQK